MAGYDLDFLNRDVPKVWTFVKENSDWWKNPCECLVSSSKVMTPPFFSRHSFRDNCWKRKSTRTFPGGIFLEGWMWWSKILGCVMTSLKVLTSHVMFGICKGKGKRCPQFLTSIGHRFCCRSSCWSEFFIWSKYWIGCKTLDILWRHQKKNSGVFLPWMTSSSKYS